MEEENQITIDVRIQVLYDSGVTKPKILHKKLSEFTNMSLRTMQRKVEKLNNGESLQRKSYERSSSVIDEELKEEIKDLVDRENVFTISDIQKEGKIEVRKSTI